MTVRESHFSLLALLGFTDVYSVADWGDSLGFSGTYNGERVLISVDAESNVSKRTGFGEWESVS